MASSLKRQPGAPSVAAGPAHLQAGLLAAFFVPGTQRPDLTLRALSVLLCLGPAGLPRSLAGLAEELGLRPAQLRSGIAALERAGLAARVESGATPRGMLVVATIQGARLIREMSCPWTTSG